MSPAPTVRIPPRYAEATLEGIAVAPLKTCVRKYGKDYFTVAPKGVAPFFCGSTQGYKTYAAAVLAKAINTSCDVRVAWVNCASDFANYERERFEPWVRAAVQGLKEAAFLVLDDFTQAATNARQRELLVEIGTARFDNLRPTLYTGNLVVTAKDTSALANLVGVCLARRILEASEGYRVLVKGAA